jgi:hypothetical protein
MSYCEGNKPGQKIIYRDSIIRTAKRYNLLHLLSPLEMKKLVEFPEEDVAIIRYLAYFIANNYTVYSKNSRYCKNTITINDVINQACYIYLEIKPFHVLVAYACTSHHLMKLTPFKQYISDTKLNIIAKNKLTYIPFDDSYFKCSRYFCKKQELEFKKIGLKRHVNIKNKPRSASKIRIISRKNKA